MADASLDDWFETHVLPHEGTLMRYLRRARINTADLVDLRQDIYVRVYESAAKRLPISPKAFLMSTARHLLIDRIRHERIVSIDYRPSPEQDYRDPMQDSDAPNVLVDERSPELRLGARQELRRLSDALDALSQDCRAVVWLRRVEGLSQREVAAQLRLQEGTVASHLSRGLRTLTKVMLGDSDDSAKEDTEKAHNTGGDNETWHG